MSLVDRLDDLWNAIADRLDNKGETEWTDVAGIVTAKRDVPAGLQLGRNNFVNRWKAYAYHHRNACIFESLCF